MIDIKEEKILTRVPSKNKFIMILMYLKWPLFIPIIKMAVKKYLKHCDNVDFFPGFQCFYGNIFAENVYLCDLFALDYAPIYIGNGTKFSFGCMVVTSHHERQDFKKIVTRPVKIGANVYFGARSIILSGVTIGDNSVIGAGSVVNVDIPKNCFAAGNPCKVIRRLDE